MAMVRGTHSTKPKRLRAPRSAGGTDLSAWPVRPQGAIDDRPVASPVGDHFEATPKRTNVSPDAARHVDDPSDGLDLGTDVVLVKTPAGPASRDRDRLAPEAHSGRADVCASHWFGRALGVLRCDANATSALCPAMIRCPRWPPDWRPEFRIGPSSANDDKGIARWWIPHIVPLQGDSFPETREARGQTTEESPNGPPELTSFSVAKSEARLGNVTASQSATTHLRISFRPTWRQRAITSAEGALERGDGHANLTRLTPAVPKVIEGLDCHPDHNSVMGRRAYGALQFFDSDNGTLPPSAEGIRPLALGAQVHDGAHSATDMRGHQR